ncbi:MAG: excinuclease ABC subunit UvrA [Candidatus Thermoplasmatota archaeon]
MVQDKIVVRGAREHNLKNIDVTLPRNKLVVITGLSGSGKSSLAFDTLYAEGQRRYVESLSAYARQFLGQMEKPEVDSIEGLSPAISIDQKTTSKNPRSTVGTITEIFDYLRVLYANLGLPHCPNDGTVIKAQTAEGIVGTLLSFPDGARLQVLAPVVKDRKGEYRKNFADYKAQGFTRVRVNGKLGTVDDDWKLARYEKHTIELVIDRVVLKKDDEDLKTRLTDAVEQALKLAEGEARILEGESKIHTFSEKFGCTKCGFSMPELAPRTFSFNAPHGACPGCLGLGFSLEVDPDVLIVDEDISLNAGCLHGTVKRASPWILYEIEQLARSYRFSLDTPWKKLSDEAKDVILNGTQRRIKVKYEMSTGRTWEGYESFEGITPRLQRYYKASESEGKRERIQALMAQKACNACKGARLKPEVLAVTVGDKNLAEVGSMPVRRLHDWFVTYEQSLDARGKQIAHEVVKEIRERLRFMIDVGLDYLTLDRSAATLSGGEGQRIRLATQIGSGLVGVLYILDEPSIGLHQRDNQRLIRSLEGLREIGNTLLVVEHDEEMIRAADWVVDLGPGAGEHGGRVIAEGTPSDIIRNRESITGQYLSGRRAIPVPPKRRDGNGNHLSIRGAKENNLKNVDMRIPLGKFVCVTGVSGSGKSTLVNDVLYRALARRLYGAVETPGKHQKLEGLDNIDKVIIIDQSPIGRTPRSNPATYTGLFTTVRDLFAQTPDAKARGYEPGRFSFNVKGGRCEKCEGDGMVKIEMHFLADVYVHCEECKGARYNKETLQAKYKGKSIKDVLDMTIEEACGFFEAVPALRRGLQTLLDVGLSYMRLGQSATTLSGGEAQRIKLATELQKRPTGKTLYILDEPTTGLHFADIERLLGVLDRLADTGNTVLVIEHNLDVIKHADWLIDLGPDGGEKGGYVIAEGTPEEVAANAGSYTGQYLKAMLARESTLPARPP